MSRMFDQKYPDFLVLQPTQDVAVVKIVPGFSTLENGTGMESLGLPMNWRTT